MLHTVEYITLHRNRAHGLRGFEVTKARIIYLGHPTYRCPATFTAYLVIEGNLEPKYFHHNYTVNFIRHDVEEFLKASGHVVANRHTEQLVKWEH